MRTHPFPRDSRVHRPGGRARIAAPLALSLVCAVGAVAVAASPAAATVSPSQQWNTSVSAVSGSGIGSSQTFTFGATGVTATQTITSVSGEGCSLSGVGLDVLANLNAESFLTPTPPANTPFGTRTCLDGSAASTLVFSRPVLKPLIHVINLDQSSLEVSGTSTSGATTHLTLLSHNSTLDISGDILNLIPNVARLGGCQAADGSNPTGGCGTAEVDAASGAIGTLALTATSGGGDGSGIVLSFPTASLSPSFSPTTMQAGGTGTLTYTIMNDAQTAQPDLSGLGFSRSSLPAGLTIASGAPTSSDCGSPVFEDGAGHSLGSGATSLQVTGVTVLTGATCRLNVPVTAAAAGSYAVDSASTTPAVANLSPSGAATLIVTAPEHPAPDHPGLGLITKVSSPLITAVGQHLSLTFLVRNTGDVALNAMGVTVRTFSGAGQLGAVDCPSSSVAVGATATCTVDYTTVATDLAAGGISLTAVAEADDDTTSAAVASGASQLHLAAVRATINAGLPGDGAGRRTPLIGLGAVLILGAAAPLLLARRRLHRTAADGVSPAAGTGSRPI